MGWPGEALSGTHGRIWQSVPRPRKEKDDEGYSLRRHQEIMTKQEYLRAFVIAPVAACLGLAILFPWGESCVLESYPFAGPLWLLKTRSWTDFWTGCGLVCVLWPMIVAVCFRTNRFTMVLRIAGTLLWIGVGCIIASGAAV